MKDESPVGDLPTLKDAVVIGAVTTGVSVLAYQLGIKNLPLMAITMAVNAALFGSRTGIADGWKMAALYSLPNVAIAFLLAQSSKSPVTTLQVLLDSVYGSFYGVALGIALGLLFKRKIRIISLGLGGFVGFFLASLLFYMVSIIDVWWSLPALLMYNIVGCTIMLKAAVLTEQAVTNRGT